MAKALEALGYAVGRHHQARSLMREAGVWVRYRRRYRLTTDSYHRKRLVPNRLQRDFPLSAPNRVGGLTSPVHLDRAGVDVPGGGHRLVLAQSGWLVAGARSDQCLGL
jgi:transposase InsO family protein